MTLDRAKFEAVRDDLLSKRADIDRLVDALNVLLGDDLLMSPRIVVAEVSQAHEVESATAPTRLPVAEPVKRLAPSVAPAPKQSVRQRPELTGVNHPEYDPDTEQKAKAMFLAGKPVRSIAAAINRSMQTVYSWSSRGRWAKERAIALQAEAKGNLPPDPTAERIRAQRRLQDDEIIEQVRQEMEATRGIEKVNSFGEGGPRARDGRVNLGSHRNGAGAFDGKGAFE